MGEFGVCVQKPGGRGRAACAFVGQALWEDALAGMASSCHCSRGRGWELAKDLEPFYLFNNVY